MSIGFVSPQELVEPSLDTGFYNSPFRLIKSHRHIPNIDFVLCMYCLLHRFDNLKDKVQ